MATVYLARDIKHQRAVAVKVLDADFAAPDSQRFLREVQVLAHLQHPHILPLFDSGQAARWLYYVMPYVAGESLRDRLHRERQLPLGDALQITREVAAALDYAHRHHVIHRDIKPANILLQDGQAIVADFGIAHLLSLSTEERITQTGISLGTPWYMSPEQAVGDPHLDARSDIYSLGAVLYEMLTGEPPHTGRDPRAVLARVATEPVRPVRTIRDSVPPSVDAALRKALAKVPADRFSSATAFARALTETDVASAAIDSTSLRRINKRAVALTVGALSVVAAGTLVAPRAWQQRSRASPSLESAAVRRWSIVLADSTPLAFIGSAPLGVGRTSLAISPDGTRLVYVGRHGSTTQLYLRDLDRLDATPLPGTVGANQPVFSPDGQWIGFFIGRELKKVSVRGGQPITLAATAEPYSATWAPDGRILIAERQGNRLSWVPGDGGVPQPIRRHIDIRVFGPQVIPGGEWILHGSIDGVLYLHSLGNGWPYAISRDSVVRRDSADVNALLYGANPRYLKSGYIAYFSGDGTLMVLPFDIARRRVLGPAVPVLEGVRLEAEAGDAQLTLSEGGTLVYAHGESARRGQFAWVDHASRRVDTLPLPKAAYGGFALSPDGRQILVRMRSASSRSELWALDVDGGMRVRIPTNGILVGSPRWSSDGAHAFYHELPRDGSRSLLTLRQSLRRPADRDTMPSGIVGPAAAGRQLVRFERESFWLVPTELPEQSPQLIVSGRVSVPVFSRDGQWVAYTDLDDPGGESTVYATRVGSPAERYKVSASGGEEPVWTPDGKTVIYRDRQSWLAVDVSTTGAFRAGKPRVLFEGAFLQVAGSSHDVSPDGRRQLVLLGPAAETTDRLVVVTNWLAEVARLAPRRGS